MTASDPRQTTVDVPESEPVFALAYYTGEALDPYTSSSRTNSELLRLCYSGLFSLDRSYTALPVLAESWTVSGATVRIRLRSDIRFSDGSPVTAADCEASYRLAAAAGSVWRSSFAYIRSYAAEDEQTFRVTFYRAGDTQLNLLTIPIVKRNGSGAHGLPVGCGRYRFSEEEPLSLVKADCGCVPGAYTIDRVSLMGIADGESLIYHFNYGRLQAICADPSSGTETYRSNNELVAVPSNRFTFLVVNKTKAPLSFSGFSRGLTYLIDRAALTEKALYSFGTGVWYPLNPAWNTVAQAGLNPEISDAAAASAAFSSAGCTLSGASRYYGGLPVKLRLVVNRESAVRIRAAEWIAEQLQGAGFEVEIRALNLDEYRAAIAALDFDLYLGEVNLPVNMDISALFRTTNCNTGEPEGTYWALQTAAAGLMTGETEVRSFVDQFHASLPLIPLYYASDALAVSTSVPGTFGTSASELYAGIENWTWLTRDKDKNA